MAHDSPESVLQQLQAQATAAAFELARLLERRRRKLVFAESCTCGLAAAMLGQCPGISQWFCGSLVTYRESAKTDWLGIDREVLAQHTAESLETAVAMAKAALSLTAEAEMSVAVTGHFGPDVADERDGRIFLASSTRPADFEEDEVIQLTQSTRQARQWEAATAVLNLARRCLEH